jgi:hypothetical protein
LILALLFVCPPLIFVLYSYCEKIILKKEGEAKVEIKGKVKLRIAIAVFIFYYLLFPILNILLKYTSINPDWYSEVAITCINVVMLMFIPLRIYAKKQIYLINLQWMNPL